MATSVVMAGGGGDFDSIAQTVSRSTAQFHVLRALSTARSAMAVLRKTKPALFLMGLDVPDAESFELIRTVSEQLPTRVVVMCRRHHAGSAVEALDAGAAGYLFAGMDDHDVLRLLRAAV